MIFPPLTKLTTARGRSLASSSHSPWPIWSTRNSTMSKASGIGPSMLSSSDSRSLIGDYAPYRHQHLQYHLWSVVKDVDQAILEVADQIQNPVDRKKILDFWSAGIVDFHLYYIYPLLQDTRCN